MSIQNRVYSPQRSKRQVIRIGRRHFGIGSLAASCALLINRRASAAQTTPANVQNVLAFGADPTGAADSAPAFQAAFSALPANGGTVYVPDGDYGLHSPVVFAGKPVSVEGNGEQSTRLFITHTGVGLSFPQPSPLYMTSVRNLGISAVSAQAECAISITFPPFPVYGMQTALIENVAAPSQLYAGYPNFVGGLQLRGCWQSVIRNFKHEAPGAGGPVTGGYFIDIGGRSVDIRITDCTGTNSDLGILLSSYTEGIHIKDTAIVSSNFGVSMPSANFDIYETSHQYSTLGLIISGSEISSLRRALQLQRVLSAYISDTHLGLLNPLESVQVVGIVDSQDVKLSGCTISGQGSQQIGILFQQVSYPCAFNESNNNFFVNLAYPIVYGQGVTGNTAIATRFTLGGTTLSNAPAIVDHSGNLTNNGQWLNSQGKEVWLR